MEASGLMLVQKPLIPEHTVKDGSTLNDGAAVKGGLLVKEGLLESGGAKSKEGAKAASLFLDILDSRMNGKDGSKSLLPSLLSGGKKEALLSSKDGKTLSLGLKKSRRETGKELPLNGKNRVKASDETEGKEKPDGPEKIDSLMKDPESENIHLALKADMQKEHTDLDLSAQRDKISFFRDAAESAAKDGAAKTSGLDGDRKDRPWGVEKAARTGGKEEPRVTVIDLRSGKLGREDMSGDQDPGAGGKRGFEGSNSRQEGGDSVIVVKGDGNAGQSYPGPVQGKTAGSFAGQLDRRLKGDLGKEIVKQTGIVVKDEGKGEIRLVLQPERLGKVRIRLDLDDNHIAAKILVENNSVREVFEQNLEHLARTFKEGGFTADSLDVSVQGDGADAEGHGKRGPMQKRQAGEMEAMVPLVDNEIREETTVNMVV